LSWVLLVLRVLQPQQVLWLMKQALRQALMQKALKQAQKAQGQQQPPLPPTE
jgi:hypothetical protein